jgi:GT2 family glycosyltransferase
MTKPLTVCAVVMTRYDLLRRMLDSLQGSTYPVAEIYIINNGRNSTALYDATLGIPLNVHLKVFTPPWTLGLAEAWNVFLREVPEERLLIADDIEVQSDTLQRLVETPGEFVTAKWFGCFIIRDTCIQKIGMFDDSISPGYLYFEDIDYAQRMMNANLSITQLELGVIHHGSATLNAIPEAEKQERHHKRFLIAQDNYIRKWGSLPNWIPQNL